MKIKRNNPVVIFLAVFGLLLILHFSGALRPLENGLTSMIKPISSRLYSLGSLFRGGERLEKAEMQAKLTALEAEVARLTVSNARQLEIAQENQELRAQLRFKSENNFRTVTAAVIARESLNEGNESGQDLIIDKGSADGLVSGLGVISSEGIIIGKLIEVKPQSAKVCLTTSPECRLAASVLNDTRTLGLTDGDLGLTIKLDFVPQLEKMQAGDIVISSGLGGKIPRGLVIGKVSAVRNESNEVWQSASIEPLVDSDDLIIVSVVIP